MTAYLVTVAVLIPLSGWVTLRYGYMRLMSYIVRPALLAPAIAPLAGGPNHVMRAGDGCS